MGGLNLNCKTVLGLLTGFIDHQLDPEKMAGVETHLSVCSSCAKAATQERRLKQAVSGMKREKPPAELTRRIRESLAEARKVGRTRSTKR